MPKFEELNIDVDELEEAEWTEGSYSSYDGEVPPAGTILKGFVSKMWWSKTKDEDEMLIAIFTAAENEGDLDEYNGWEAWEYLALTKGAKFRWKPFIDAFGITLTDIRSKVRLDAEDDNVGSPITHIGKFEVGGDAAWCRVVTKRERYQGEWRGKVDKWLPYEEDEEQEPEPEPTPTRRSAAKSGRTSSAPTTSRQTSSARGARKSRATEPVEDEPDDEPADEPTPARRGSGRATPARTAASAPARGRGRGRSSATDEDPPF